MCAFAHSLPRPHRTYLVKNLHKEIIIRSPKREVLKGQGTIHAFMGPVCISLGAGPLALFLWLSSVVESWEGALPYRI